MKSTKEERGQPGTLTSLEDYLGGLVVLGTRRLQRLRARTFLSVAPTDVSHKRLGVGGDRQV